MQSMTLPVLWNDVIVGYISNPKVDNFDLYGVWIPLQSAETMRFIDHLDKEAQLEVYVGIDQPRIKGTIEQQPGKYIEIKIRQ